MTATIDFIAPSALRRSSGKGAVRTALRDPRTRTGIAFLAVVLGIALFGPLAAPHAIDDYVGAPYAWPSTAYPLGTDFMGQDVLSRVLSGGWTVVWMSVASAVIGMILGVALGTVAGYAGGWLDELVMRASDVLLAIPSIVFVLLIVSVFGRDHWLLVLLIGISHAPQVARVTRSVTVDVREQEFVESAQAFGATPGRIIVEQILPNISTTLLVEFGLRVVWSIVALASLSVLGQGVSAPAADWGLMINENRAGLTFQPFAVLAPLILVSVFALGANLVAEGVGRSVGGRSAEGR